MIHLSIEGTEVLLEQDTTMHSTEIRAAVPGVQWDGVKCLWKIPLKRRPVLALRKFLTGRDVSLTPDVGRTLASIADSEPAPDIHVVKDRIVITFDFHVKYQNFVMAMNATLREDGTWSLPVEAADDLKAAIEGDENIDLIIAPEVYQVKQKPIPGFDGTLASLRTSPLENLRVIKENVQSVKSRKKTDLGLGDRFRQMGIENLFDLALYFPLRYLDRSQPMLIRGLVEGNEGVVVGKIHDIQPYDRTKRMTRVIVEDVERHRISVTFFQQPWINKRFHSGQEIILTGKFGYWKPQRGNPVPQMSEAQMDPLLTSGRQKVIPVYPQSEKNLVSTYDIQRSTKELFNRLEPIVDEIPEDHSISYDRAIRAMHFPESMDEVDQARERLVHDELLLLQLHILANKQQLDNVPGISQPVRQEGRMLSFVKNLPYELTDAQRHTLNDLANDFKSDRPMHRLLQGDVSSGKTTIAHAMMLNAVDNGHQGVILAPTEILAEQLYLGLAQSMAHTDLRVEFLGLKVKGKKRQAVLEGLADGSVNVLVGTHAVLVDEVVFHDLSTIVIDEQHRFGAMQRSILRSRRQDHLTPDMLVMTATPIPRTGAMVLYGDLDLSVLDELPPGRIPIKTEWLTVNAEESVTDWTLPAWAAIKEQVAQGRQAYVVASLVEDSDTIAAASTQAAYEALQNGVLSDLRLGIMHGKMNRADREEVMAKFASGDIDVLVATTVIEVGVNVPNATIMVVLDAGRFGIAQLHQIRGRVGRASWQSTCYLVGDVHTPDGRSRMEALVASTDGFYLAEKDLEIRGEGALFGTRQSGDSDLRIASLRRDISVLENVRVKASGIIEQGGATYERLLNLTKEHYQDKEIAS